MPRKHPKQLRAEKKARALKLGIVEDEIIEHLAKEIRIEIDREIIDRLKREKKTQIT